MMYLMKSLKFDISDEMRCSKNQIDLTKRIASQKIGTLH